MSSTDQLLETFSRLDFEVQLSTRHAVTLSWSKWETVGHAPTAAKAQSDVRKRKNNDLGISKSNSSDRRYRVVRVESLCTVLQ